MKKLFFMAVAAIAALSSCTSDNELELNQNTGKEALTFTATIESIDGTRATFDATDSRMKWENGDKINIWGHVPNDKFYHADYSAQTAGTTTAFAAVGDGLSTSKNYEFYYAVFPTYLDDEDATETKKMMPAYITETWKEGLFNMPMFAASTTPDLQFMNLCGVLKIVVKNDELSSVKRIRVSNTGRGLSGRCEVVNKNQGGGTDLSLILAMDEEAIGYNETNAITVTYTSAVETDATGKAFYIAIPPYDKYRDLQIEIDPDGKGFTKFMKTKAGKDINIERNKIYEISFAGQASAPSGSKGKAAVSSTAGAMDNEVRWIQLWAGGPKFAEYNVGVTDGKAESFGGYYTWGGLENAEGQSDPSYNQDLAALTGDTDTATKLWGSNWRMPTGVELEALFNGGNCEAEVVTEANGWVLGIKFTGKGDYSTNSIFLPAAGYFYYEAEVSCNFEEGDYWSSTPDDDESAFCSSFDKNGYTSDYTSGDRLLTCSIRAVLNEATTGTAKATINSVETDVNWVQLWKDGPKFAEKNVGATSATDQGTMMTFTEATKAGADYVWGANWCTPSKEDMEHLMTAAMGETDDKVKCEYTSVGGQNGFKFTGKEDGYTDNSVFFPAAMGGSSYWSATVYDDSKAWGMYLEYSIYDYDWYSFWCKDEHFNEFLVRPVLAK